MSILSASLDAADAGKSWASDPALRVVADPSGAGIEWRCWQGARQFRVRGYFTWYMFSPHFAERYSATPERIAVWLDLALNPTVP